MLAGLEAMRVFLFLFLLFFIIVGERLKVGAQPVPLADAV